MTEKKGKLEKELEKAQSENDLDEQTDKLNMLIDKNLDEKEEVMKTKEMQKD